MTEAAPAADAAPTPVPGLASTAPAVATPPAASPPDGAPQQTSEDQKQDKPKRPASERISELYGRMKSAERERDLAIAELERARQPTVSPEQFQQLSYDEQQRAIVRDAVREERAAELEQAARYRAHEAQALRGQQFAERVAAAREAIPDLDEKLSDPTLPISEHAAHILSESEKGPQMAYWLASNRAEAERISRLPPGYQAYELGKIEARINAAPASRRVSQAPSPVPMVGGGSGGGARDPAAMSHDEMSAYLRSKGVIR